MQLETAKALQKGAILAEVEATVRESYQGRGMYGSCTTALVLESTAELSKIVAYAVRGMDEEQFNEFVNDLEFRIDNMGKGIVIY